MQEGETRVGGLEFRGETRYKYMQATQLVNKGGLEDVDGSMKEH